MPDLDGNELLTLKIRIPDRISEMNSKNKTKAVDDLPSWKTLNLESFKKSEFKVAAPALIRDSGDHEQELNALYAAIGINSGVASIDTPIGSVYIYQEKLDYIVTKEGQFRARFANYIPATLEDPFEVWEVPYTDGTTRLHFIGLFEGKDNMYVIVWTDEDGRQFYNAFPIGVKKNYLNNKRIGKLLYKADR